MAGNRRGRIKERFEGIHKNLDWVLVHCQQCLNLIKDDNPKLSAGIKALAGSTETIDALAKAIYDKL